MMAFVILVLVNALLLVMVLVDAILVINVLINIFANGDGPGECIDGGNGFG